MAARQSLKKGAASASSMKFKRKRLVYGWGLAATGALGNHDLLCPPEKVWREPVRIQEKPLRLEFSKHNPVVSVACGHGFSLLATKQSVYGCGLNTLGQLSFQTGAAEGVNNQWVWVPQLMQLPPNTAPVVQMAAGRAHSILLTKTGEVYSCGLNSQGQCGRPIIEDEQYSQAPSGILKVDLNEPCSSVVAGLDHSTLIMRSGRLISFGCNADGQLGRKTSSTNDWRPTQVESEHRFVGVSSAADTVLALTDQATVLAWGNNEYKQIRDGGPPSIIRPEVLSSIMNLGERAPQAKIRSIAAGGSGCMAVTENGMVYVWGYGMLGVGPNINQSHTPIQVPPALFGGGIKPSGIQSIYASVQQYGCVNALGELFVWGNNRFGLTGKKEDDHKYAPSKVKGLRGRVAQVALSNSHSLVLVED